MSNIEKIEKIISEADVFYLATVKEDKPKCRPLGFHMLSDGKIYFGVGTFKDVYKQMEANPNIEIVAWNGEKFLRYYGKANLDYNPEIVDKAFELMPEIAEVYKANGWKMGTFYIENATAEIRNMMEIEETYTFE